MLILSAHFKNWCQHRDLTVEFKPGLNGVIGSNGKGKSSILSGLAFAFTGEPTSFGAKGDNLTFGAKSGYVEVVFQHHQHQYRLRRSIEKSSQSLTGPDLDLTRSAEIAQALVKLVGATPQVLLNNVFSTQGEIDRILYTPPADRLREFQSTFGLVRAEQAYKALGTEVASYTLTTGLRQRLTELTNRLSEARTKQSEVSAEQARLANLIQQAEPHKEVLQRALEARKHQALLAQATTRQHNATKQVGLASHAVELSGPAAQLAQEQLPQLDQAQQRLSAELAERASLADQIGKLNERKQLRAQRQAVLDALPAFDESVLPGLREASEQARNAAKQLADMQNGRIVRPPTEAEKVAKHEIDRLSGELARIVPDQAVMETVAERRARLTELRGHIEGFDGGVCPTCGQAVLGGPEKVAEIKSEIADLEAGVAALLKQEAERVATTKKVLNEQIAEQRRKLAELAEAWNNLLRTKSAAATEAVRQASEVLRAAERAQEELVLARSQLDRCGPDPEAELAELSGRLARLPGEAELNAQLAKITPAREAANKAISQARTDQAALIQAQREEAAAAEQLVQLSAQVQAPSEEEVAIATEALRDLPELVQAHNVCLNEVGIAQGVVASLSSEVDSAAKQLTREAKDAEWVELVRRARDQLHVTALPALIMREYARRLNAQIAHYLECWESPFRMWIDDDLAFQVEFPDRRHEAARLSGGQKIVASTSFRFAMADLFASRVGLLVLDEPSTALDEANIINLQRLLLKLKEMPGHCDRQIIMVTHEARLMSFLENVIEL